MYAPPIFLAEKNVILFKMSAAPEGGWIDALDQDGTPKLISILPKTIDRFLWLVQPDGSPEELWLRVSLRGRDPIDVRIDRKRSFFSPGASFQSVPLPGDRLPAELSKQISTLAINLANPGPEGKTTMVVPTFDRMANAYDAAGAISRNRLHQGLIDATLGHHSADGNTRLKDADGRPFNWPKIQMNVRPEFGDLDDLAVVHWKYPLQEDPTIIPLTNILSKQSATAGRDKTKASAEVHQPDPDGTQPGFGDMGSWFEGKAPQVQPSVSQPVLDRDRWTYTLHFAGVGLRDFFGVVANAYHWFDDRGDYALVQDRRNYLFQYMRAAGTISQQPDVRFLSQLNQPLERHLAAFRSRHEPDPSIPGDFFQWIDAEAKLTSDTWEEPAGLLNDPASQDINVALSLAAMGHRVSLANAPGTSGSFLGRLLRRRGPLGEIDDVDAHESAMLEKLPRRTLLELVGAHLARTINIRNIATLQIDSSDVQTEMLVELQDILNDDLLMPFMKLSDIQVESLAELYRRAKTFRSGIEKLRRVLAHMKVLLSRPDISTNKLLKEAMDRQRHPAGNAPDPADDLEMLGYDLDAEIGFPALAEYTREEMHNSRQVDAIFGDLVLWINRVLDGKETFPAQDTGHGDPAGSAEPSTGSFRSALQDADRKIATFKKSRTVHAELFADVAGEPIWHDDERTAHAACRDALRAEIKRRREQITQSQVRGNELWERDIQSLRRTLSELDRVASWLGHRAVWQRLSNEIHSANSDASGLTAAQRAAFLRFKARISAPAWDWPKILAQYRKQVA